MACRIDLLGTCKPAIFASDTCINKYVPFFATSKRKTEYPGKRNTGDEKETKIMELRWEIFEFFHRILQEEQKSVTPCPIYFFELILLDSSD